jgi:hypothetical protein
LVGSTIIRDIAEVKAQGIELATRGGITERQRMGKWLPSLKN